MKSQFKENPKALETTKEEENKHDVSDEHKNEAQSPWTNLEGRAICSLHQKFKISRACETKLWLGYVLSFLEDAIT